MYMGELLFKLPVCSAKDVVKILEKFDYVVLRAKSHIIMKHTSTGQRISIPNHKEIKKGTLRNIINMAGLTRKQFINAL